MTDLLSATFEDEHGVTRTLTRDEALLYVNIVAGAGNETTNRLIGWTGKVLADHPDQRRQIVEDPALVGNAIEELLRFETPGPITGRYVTRGRRAARADRARRQRPAPPEPLRQPRRASLRTTRTASTSTGRRPDTSPSGTGSTSASARR